MFEASQHGRLQPCGQIVLQHYSDQVSFQNCRIIGPFNVCISNKQVFRAQAGESVQKEFVVGQVHAERVEKESSPPRSHSVLKCLQLAPIS